MALPLRRRIACSLEATSITWLISGTVFALVVKGPNTIGAWLIWGTVFFLFGWTLVGLPVVALGDKVLRMSAFRLMIVAGAGGALVMELPFIITKVVAAGARSLWSWNLQELAWPGVAFGIAALAAWLYRRFLKDESTKARIVPLCLS